jgi:hypothetical protein
MADKVEKKANPLENLTADQIRVALANLTPDKLAAIRAVAAQSGMAQNEKFKRLPNGDIQMVVLIPNDLAEGLMTVCDAAGENNYEFIHGIVMQGINGWFLGGVEDEAPAITPKTTIPIGTPA